MNNTRDDILHLAKLSNLQLTDAKISALQQDVTNIVGYISQLDELDTTGVEPTYQVFEMENVWRADEIKSQDATREQLLTLAPDQAQNMIKVQKVL
ncbi:Asp-tRNA(Asn)/Glu-tRNA(Gln) amidotransferase subunit GatC [Candidatus Saccharibacteria bacterium]|nr:Asp-tRNA(Asn)/Glu-tRNA(Gln) amidotransferase subunit GatC [Candidatus Saccharibacteria bacterium]